MRLLRRCDTGDFNITQVSDEAIPPYAILSHMWGADTEEVTFEDLTNGAGKDKPGYKKIRFCGEQAAQDGLECFWIDTCCIDKTNKVELSQAIKSMFRWYQKATRCYVYLSDVPSSPSSDVFDSGPWELYFRKSRWFTRGWTLQELLAPSSVQFFSQQHKRLGDKMSLTQQIHEITGIPKRALQGGRLSRFSVNDRLSWIEHRQTRLEEDRVYSLLGLFDVYIPPIYGEGIARASTRLMEEITKLEKCMQDLRLTDPRDDKKRIEDTKGGLLEDSYRWIFKNSSFQQWYSDQQSRLLWIKGDPGKGKTMLLCGVVNELKISIAKPNLLSYFFCQATDSRINSATAVLRGLLYLLISRQPSLISHIRKKYDQAGKALFEDVNAWVALSEIFIDTLQDSSLNNTYLIIDALDECVVDLPKLLDFITHNSSISSRVKWVVSSRNWPYIEERLERAGHRVRLNLELNVESVSTAVSIFIQDRVRQLAVTKEYDDKMRDAVLGHLSLHANDTFLWVALVCKNLENTERWNTPAKLNAFPPGLDSLYERMMQQISNLKDLDDIDRCKRVLALIAIVYQPITLEELVSLTEMPEDKIDRLKPLRDTIDQCGSFLTIRQGTVYFVHQSAKDFLFTKALNDIFPSGKEESHYIAFSRSLRIMSEVLQRNMYKLRSLGHPAEVKQLDSDPLAASRYSCIYWVNHLCDCNPNSSGNHAVSLRGRDSINSFIREKFLYWLEALSLCKSIPQGVVLMMRLETIVQRTEGASELLELVQDACRFIMFHKWAIEESPLQVYTSALMFSPARSLIRQFFQSEGPKGITIKPAMENKWSACLQTFESHNDKVRSVAFSHNSAWLASASFDQTIKIWDASSGECLQTLRGHSSSIRSVAFSHDSARLASASYDKTVKIWDASSGGCLQTLRGHSSTVRSAAFSHNSVRLASASDDHTVKIWDADNGKCLRTLKGHGDALWSVAFSHDSAQLASASDDKTVIIWDANSGECLRTLNGHSGYVRSVTFSHDSAWLASASDDNTVKIWDASSGECLQTLKGYRSSARSVAFSHDSTHLASGSSDRTIKIWNVSSGKCLQTLKGHGDVVRSVAFSHDSGRLASASDDKTIKIWDVSSSECLQAPKGHNSFVRSVAFSHDSTQLMSVSYDDTVKIWNISSGECLQTFRGNDNFIRSTAFSHGSARLALASSDDIVKIWDTSSGECLQTIKGHQKTEGHNSFVRSVAFSHDSSWLASASDNNTVKIWDASSGECLQTLKGHSSSIRSEAFSQDSTLLASVSDGNTIKICDASNKECLHTLKGHSSSVWSVAFSHDSAWLASASDDNKVKIWDVISGECLQTLKGHGSFVWSVAFSHDSTRVVSVSYDDTVKIWDSSSGECLQTLEGHGDALWSVAFSHDSARLASASDDNTVKIWDTKSGEHLYTLKGHRSFIWSIAFSHNSAQLASASYDNTVKIWDASSGECLHTLKGHNNSVWSVAFSHNSALLASASDDNTVKIWDTSSGKCLHTLSIGRVLYSISFKNDSYLHTEIGTIDIRAPQSSTTPTAIAKPLAPEYEGLALSSDNVWITYKSKNLVRLPSEYRPLCSAVSGNTIGIGVGTGRVWICRIEPNELNVNGDCT